MNIELYWELIGLRDLSSSDIQYALAVFAYEYAEKDSREVIDYQQFKN